MGGRRPGSSLSAGGGAQVSHRDPSPRFARPPQPNASPARHGARSPYVTVEPSGLRLADGSLLPLISGAVQYWRLERQTWSAILEAVKEMGFNIIETYIPWGVHEVDHGRYDFGEGDPAKDLNAFLALCQSKGIYVFLRPGPNTIAELTWYGFPKRILVDPEIQALTRDRSVALYDFLPKPGPVPSYASEKLYAEFGAYLDAVFEVVRPHLHPHGCVLGFQADNEFSYFFRLAAYDLDYAPASVALYRRFLQERYGEVGALNKTYGTEFAGFDDVDPPTGFRARDQADLAYYLDWARYKEYYLLYGLQRLAAMLRERGADGLIVYHNYPGLVAAFPTTPYNSPFDFSRAEELLDLCGVDSYHTRETYWPMRVQAQYLAATSRLPFIPELGSGAWPWVRPPLPEDLEFTTLALLMHGVKAFNFYVLVDRDRWVGSPITRDNRRRAGYFEFCSRFNDFIRQTGILEFQKVTPVVLLAARDYERFASASAVFTPPSRQFLKFPRPEAYLSEEPWGFRWPIGLEALHWWREWNQALTAAGCTFDLSDSGLPLERLARYAVAVVSSFDFMDRDTQERLIAYARGGGTLIIGPEVPRLDGMMLPGSPLGECIPPQATSARVGQGQILRVDRVPPAAQLAQTLDSLGCGPLARVSDSSVDLVVHRRGARLLYFLANPTAEERVVSLAAGGAASLGDLWSNDRLAAQTIALAPFSIRVLEPIADD